MTSQELLKQKYQANRVSGLRVDAKIHAKVKKYVKKTRQTIGGFYDIAAEKLLNELKTLKSK